MSSQAVLCQLTNSEWHVGQQPLTAAAQRCDWLRKPGSIDPSKVCSVSHQMLSTLMHASKHTNNVTTRTNPKSTRPHAPYPPWHTVHSTVVLPMHMPPTQKEEAECGADCMLRIGLTSSKILLHTHLPACPASMLVLTCFVLEPLRLCCSTSPRKAGSRTVDSGLCDDNCRKHPFCSENPWLHKATALHTALGPVTHPDQPWRQ
jgi:hypothetical protein